jgi:hypothetical protein
VDISPLRGLDRSVDGRSGRPCTSRLGAAVSLRGSNRILRFRQRRTRLYSKKFGRGAISNGADARPHRTFVACDKKLAFQFENILPIHCSPTFHSYRPLRAQRRGRLLRFRSLEAEIQTALREPSFRESRGVASNARRPAVAGSAPRRNPIKHKLCLYGLRSARSGSALAPSRLA